MVTLYFMLQSCVFSKIFCILGMSKTSELMAPPECFKTPMQVPQKLLMGPGPSNAPKRVLEANALPLLGHLHPEFIQVSLFESLDIGRCDVIHFCFLDRL